MTKNLTKSLAELDALADELLEKSVKTSDDKEGLKPEDISENVPEQEIKGTEDETNDKKNEDVDKEKEDTSIQKSINTDPEDEKEDEEEEDKEKDVAEEIEKSMNEFLNNEEIQKGIDASEFLSSCVEILAKSLGELRATVGQSKNSKDNDDKDNSTEVLAKSLKASMTLNKSLEGRMRVLEQRNLDLEKSLNDGLETLKGFISDQMDGISHQPSHMRKSVQNISVHDRNFQKSLSGGQSTVETLSKSEVLTKLNNCLYSGNPIVTPTDIISYESGAPLRPEVAQLIYN